LQLDCIWQNVLVYIASAIYIGSIGRYGVN